VRKIIFRTFFFVLPFAIALVVSAVLVPAEESPVAGTSGFGGSTRQALSGHGTGARDGIGMMLVGNKCPRHSFDVCVSEVPDVSSVGKDYSGGEGQDECEGGEVGSE
jgi:hypothetical protein